MAAIPGISLSAARAAGKEPAVLKYLIKRIAVSLVVLIGITFLVYWISTLMDGSPASLLITPDMTVEQVEELEQSMGLDQPVLVRYWTWLVNFFKGNLGTSYNYRMPVTDLIAERLKPTLILTLSALVVAVLIAIPAGTLAAYKPYSIFDYAFSGISFLGAATPAFFMGLLVIYIFGLVLGILPTSGMHAVGDESLGSYIRYAILPVGTLAFGLLGSLIRQTRSAVLEVMNEDFIRTDRAQGYGEGRVIIHALRNALIPIVTSIGNMVPFLIGGSMVVETTFGYPGIGRLMTSSITARDYPVIVSITTLIAVAVLATNIVVDIIYTLLDPRVTHTKKSR